MARYTGSVCRLCRREGLKLYLKSDRCYSDKCAIERRDYPPGQHGQSRPKFSDYAVQLREKQKVKRIYGVLEKQFRKYFEKADKTKGITGEILLLLLEKRIDNMVFRFGFASSRSEARQLVRHNHFLVDGKRVNIPSYQVTQGETLEVREKSKKMARIIESMEAVARRGVPHWLELDKENMKGSVISMPSREDLTMPMKEQLIVELYSK